MKEKLKTASYSEKIKILTLVPDKLSQKYCSECFDVTEYLVRTASKLNKLGSLLANPAPKKRKNYHQ